MAYVSEVSDIPTTGWWKFQCHGKSQTWIIRYFYHGTMRSISLEMDDILSMEMYSIYIDLDIPSGGFPCHGGIPKSSISKRLGFENQLFGSSILAKLHMFFRRFTIYYNGPIWYFTSSQRSSQSSNRYYLQFFFYRDGWDAVFHRLPGFHWSIEKKQYSETLVPNKVWERVATCTDLVATVGLQRSVFTEAWDVTVRISTKHWFRGSGLVCLKSRLMFLCWNHPWYLNAHKYLIQKMTATLVALWLNL